ncbi:hypothetical protein N0V93_009059 [Gnomoniopsis smithogilvyi]|uniref:Uncharacterized protein n=1 Tax=Gnomoniopsis smithogilvyi TaxID=1191159 RepID=A0A9W8YJR0_9PEZI|nr:hypothetical protein N0V93_009059 [Gnomoniopsis smithogilvyi]
MHAASRRRKSRSLRVMTGADLWAVNGPVPRRLTPGRRGSGRFTDPDVAIHAATKQTIKRIVLAGAVFLIVAVGTVTGALLKSDRDVVKQREAVVELSLEERIAMLESRRAELVHMKMPVERKLAELRERMKAERNAAEGKA